MSETHQRKEDSPLRIWAPILIPVITIAVAWGSMNSQLTTLTETQQDLVVDVRELRDSRTRTEVNLLSLERVVDDSKVSTHSLTELARKIGQIEAKMSQITVNSTQIWPRLRTVETNITLLEGAIKASTPGLDLRLKKPTKF